MLTSGINFFNFKKNNNYKRNSKILTALNNEKNQVTQSLSKNYRNNFSKKLLKKYKKSNNFRIIGMGGSILGSKAIYYFLKSRIKKNFDFIDNLSSEIQKNKKKNVNLIVSKSGNTFETIINSKIFLNNNDKNIFLTENKNNDLYIIAKKLKAEVVHHNNFIGGRYSVLSEVGMLPAELMGLRSNNFRQYNSLIKNKRFITALIDNVSSTLKLIKNKKCNSIIINYDEGSKNLFEWYQQLIAESLGKKNKGFLPVISNMPKDNHSVMQFYLDGFKSNFFTFFYSHENNLDKISNYSKLSTNYFKKNRKLSEIIYAQKKATENIFKKKKIPFRSFEIKKRNEKTLGELFCFFILETILLARCLKINPYDQPAVELLKKETKKILI